MNFEDWSEEWPKEEGYYHFVGGMPASRDPEPRLIVAHVGINGQGLPIYTGGGWILFKGEGWKGLWKKIDMDEFPMQFWRDKFVPVTE